MLTLQSFQQRFWLRRNRVARLTAGEVLFSYQAKLEQLASEIVCRGKLHLFGSC